MYKMKINQKYNKDKFINITNAYKIILESFTKPAKNLTKHFWRLQYERS